MKKYARTIKELATFLPNLDTHSDGISLRAASLWKSKFAWTPTPKGYDVAKCRLDVMESIKDRMEKSGDRDEKTRLECVRLRVLIDIEGVELKRQELTYKKAKGELIDKSDMVIVLSKMGADFRQMVEAFRQSESAKCRSAKDKKKIDDLCDHVFGLVEKWNQTE